jgi:hypothetical protein
MLLTLRTISDTCQTLTIHINEQLLPLWSLCQYAIRKNEMMDSPDSECAKDQQRTTAHVPYYWLPLLSFSEKKFPSRTSYIMNCVLLRSSLHGNNAKEKRGSCVFLSCNFNTLCTLLPYSNHVHDHKYTIRSLIPYANFSISPCISMH